MKPFILLTIIIAVATSTAAQSKDSSLQLIRKKCGIDRISLPQGKYGQGFPQLFKQLRVMDERPDTARIGIVRIGAVRQHEVLFHTAPAVQLAEYLNSAYSKPAGRSSLLIILKDLWISTPDSFQSIWNSEWNIRFHVEAFLCGKNGYQPLTRIDSTVEGVHGEDTRTVGAKKLRELFDVFMDQVAACDFSKERRSVSLQQIDSLSGARFAYPMDTSTIFQKGVYATVDEFLNNSPTIQKYSVDSDASGNLELSLPDETGKVVFNHTVWGYCDGSRPYVMMDGNFFPIFISGHQFYVMGSKEYLQRTYQTPYQTPFMTGSIVYLGADIKGKTTRTLRIFRIDPETGKVTE